MYRPLLFNRLDRKPLAYRTTYSEDIIFFDFFGGISDYSLIFFFNLILQNLLSFKMLVGSDIFKIFHQMKIFKLMILFSVVIVFLIAHFNKCCSCPMLKFCVHCTVDGFLNRLRRSKSINFAKELC